ncbi:MAG: DNA polymerase I [Phycisphaerales bacterium]
MPAAQDAARPTLYLIDGHAQFFRAYYAIRGGMSSPVTGEPTNLTFGFVGMLIKLLREHRPDYLAVAIDVGGDRETFRSELYPEYKANRESAPEDFHPQVERCLEILKRMAVPVIGEAGVEADDVIATMVRRVREQHPDVDVRIISRDKDLTQLVGDGVDLFDLMKDEVVTPEKLFKTEGVEPKHVGDILALMGDTADNIPGVPGVGEKTAAKLILQYGSLDGLLADLDGIKGKRGENLRACAEQIPLARQLVALKDDVAFDFDLADARYDPREMDAPAVLDVFRTLDFGGHSRSIQALAGTKGDARDGGAGAGNRGGGGGGIAVGPGAGGGAGGGGAAAANSGGGDGAGRGVDDGAGTLFAGIASGDGGVAELAPVQPAEPNGQYAAVTDEAALAGLLDRVKKAGRACIDTETDSLAARTAGLCGVSIAVEPGEGFYVPIRSPNAPEHLDEATVVEALRPLLADPSLELIAHNAKFDLTVLRRAGLDARSTITDTMVADYLLNPERSSHKMDALAEDMLGLRCIPITDLIGVRGRGKTQKRFDEVDLELAVPYAAEDADITLRLADALDPKLEAAELDGLFHDVEMPLVRVLAEMEWNGIRVDPAELERQREALQERIEALRSEISDAAPYPFDPASPKQLAGVLFGEPDAESPGLGLKVVKRGKTGPSTDMEVLEKLAADPDADSPIPSLIIEFRQLTKLVSTYLVALADAINPETGRIHASFNQTVAATGRLSSSDPNLQNIPIRTDVGRRIRRAFVADPGHHLLTADYSQIELRVLAHLSQDPALIAAFHAGADIHRAVAAEVFGVDPDDVTDEQRGSAKMVNFGIVYGITAFGLARRLGDSVKRSEAQAIIDGYKERFVGIESFLQRCIDEAKATGAVKTILGRRRPIDTIDSRNPAQRALGERMAINTVVQGSAADLIKVAMVNLHQELPEAFPNARLLLQIHDELVLEVPTSEAEAVQAFVVDRMESAMTLDVPLIVGAAHSPSWIDAK